MRHSTRQQRANGAMKYVGAFVRHPHSPSAFATVRMLPSALVAVYLDDFVSCAFCFYEHKDKFTRSGVELQRHDDDVAETAQVGIPSFMRFYLFIYSNKLQCQLNHHTLLVCCFSLSALFAVCYAPFPPSHHSLTSASASVGELIFRLYRKSLFLFALECVVPLIATQ